MYAFNIGMRAPTETGLTGGCTAAHLQRAVGRPKRGGGSGGSRAGRARGARGLLRRQARGRGRRVVSGRRAVGAPAGAGRQAREPDQAPRVPAPCRSRAGAPSGFDAIDDSNWGHHSLPAALW